MSLKKKLGLGVASAALGLSLIGGGTYAYFSDTAETTSKFAAGTLDLNANPTTIIDMDNLKPGDTILRSFALENGGSLDIAEILLETSYEESVAGFGEHIRVNFLLNADKVDVPIYSTTLANLVNATPDVIEGNIFSAWLGERGGSLAPGTSDTLYVQFEFVDNNQDQNDFQGAELALKWTFEGKQGAGQAR
ncbi:CalY family protein [Sutcliffiella horikoshii]|uniref:CalY family protein n=1 Tax=Sutcliffiella horikoshii TaxID=79883 RepID=UPI003850A53C